MESRYAGCRWLDLLAYRRKGFIIPAACNFAARGLGTPVVRQAEKEAGVNDKLDVNEAKPDMGEKLEEGESMRALHPPRVLTIDLEDWFHPLEPDPGRGAQFDWRAEAVTIPLLELLGQYKARATFSVLGCVAERFAGLVKRVADEGHEIGTHGYYHINIYERSREEFRHDLRESMEIIKAITGRAPRCFRAPNFSITSETLWALDILKQEGIEIDSSIFPIRNPRYGIPDACRMPNEILPGLWEWPISTLPTILGNFPFAGGAYLRLLPWRIIRYAIRKLEQRGEPILIYLHPWEFDPEQPRFATESRFTNFRHYYGLDKTIDKVTRLLRQARYTTLSEGLEIWRNIDQAKAEFARSRPHQPTS